MGAQKTRHDESLNGLSSAHSWTEISTRQVPFLGMLLKKNACSSASLKRRKGFLAIIGGIFLVVAISDLFRRTSPNEMYSENLTDDINTGFWSKRGTMVPKKNRDLSDTVKSHFAASLSRYSEIGGRIGYSPRQYPPCPKSQPPKNSPAVSDLDHTLWQIETTNVLREPFEHAFYCELFPFPLYQELDRTFPITAMQQKIGNPFDNEGQTRDVISLSDIVLGKVDVSSDARHAWSRLDAVLRSRAFSEALFKKYGLEDRIGKYKGPGTRLLAHDAGFELNIHPDASTKLMTMMLYFPPTKEYGDMVWDYGTNVHTAAQKTNDNIDDWYLRYLFLPNSAYVMKISNVSYHSVSKLPPGHRRRTLVLNWWSSETDGHEDLDAKSSTRDGSVMPSTPTSLSAASYSEMKAGFLLSAGNFHSTPLKFDYKKVLTDLAHLESMEKVPTSATDVEKWPFSPSDGNGFCISVGATSGTDDPMWPLLHKGYSGVFFEAQEATYKKLADNVKAFPGVVASNTPMTPLNAKMLLDKYSVPDTVDWLKMNIDSCDCPLTEAIVQARRVKLVVMETNHNIPPPIIWGLNYSPDTRFCVRPHAYYGCSLMYQVELLKQYGYSLLSYRHGDALFGLSEMVSTFSKPGYSFHPLAHFLHDKRSKQCVVDSIGCHNTADETVMRRIYDKITEEDLDGALEMAKKFFEEGKEFCEQSQNQGFQSYELSKVATISKD